MPNIVDLLDEEDEKEIKQEQLLERAINQTPENHDALIIDAFTKFDNIPVSQNSSLKKIIWRHCFFSPRPFYDKVEYGKNDIPYTLAMILEKLVGQYDSMINVAQGSLKNALIELNHFFIHHNGTITFNHEKDTIEKQKKPEYHSYLVPRHPFAYAAAQLYCSRLNEDQKKCVVKAVSIVELLELLVMSEYIYRIKDSPNHNALNSILLYDQSRISTRFGRFLRYIDSK